MKTDIMRYQVIIRKEGSDFIAHVPTLGISDFGTSVREAKKHVTEAIRTHIHGLVKTGTEVPPPDTEDFYISSSEVPIPKGIKFAF